VCVRYPAVASRGRTRGASANHHGARAGPGQHRDRPGLTTDAEYVADFLNSLTGPVVLVGHSYGGSVITNAAAGSRKVKALVYVDAAAPDVGETNGSLSGTDSVLSRKPKTELFDKLPYPGAPPGAADLYLRKDVFIQSFANDLPPDVATRLWASQRTASTEAFDTPSQHAAWKTIPSWYFISSGDQIITPTSEMAMAKRAHSRITLFPGGSHLTLISHPDAVTEVIRAAIGSLHCSRSRSVNTGAIAALNSTWLSFMIRR
jgi:pimeloyl-ACP methyl ester carboxylesterase